MCINTEQRQLVYELQLYLCVASICLSLYINTHTSLVTFIHKNLYINEIIKCHNDSISVTIQYTSLLSRGVQIFHYKNAHYVD